MGVNKYILTSEYCHKTFGINPNAKIYNAVFNCLFIQVEPCQFYKIYTTAYHFKTKNVWGIEHKEEFAVTKIKDFILRYSVHDLFS